MKPAAFDPAILSSLLLRRTSQLPEISRPALNESTAAFLRQLAAPGLSDLLNAIESERLQPRPESVRQIIDDAVRFLRNGDVAGALNSLRHALVTDPEHGETLIRAESALAPVHHEVRSLIANLEHAARIDAQQALSSPAMQTEPALQALALAQRFVEAGGYANYIRAAEIGRRIPRPALRRTQISFDVAVRLWRRAPLLALLIVWFALGVVAVMLSGTAAALWAIGLLALIAAQFVITVRNFRLH